MRLTPAGDVFLALARRVVALVDVAPAATRRAAEGQTGTLRLAFTAIGAYAVLAETLALVNERIPAVSIELTELVSPAQFEALAGLEIDLGLVRPPIPEQFESVLVHSEGLVLAVPQDHPLAGEGRPVALADVTADYIGYSPEGSRYLHDICAAMIGMNRFAVSQLVSRVPTMLALVRAGLGCALVPRSIMGMGGGRRAVPGAGGGRQPLGDVARVLEPGQPEPGAAAGGGAAPAVTRRQLAPWSP